MKRLRLRRVWSRPEPVFPVAVRWILRRVVPAIGPTADRRSKPRRRWLQGALVLAAALPAHAAPEPGAFQLTSGHTKATVAAWGEDCGPVPTSHDEPAGATYTLDAGGMLRPESRAAALFAPGVCQQATGLRQLAEVLQGSTGTCRSSDPARRVDGNLSLNLPDPNRLVVHHRFEYDWTFRGQTCRVSLASEWRLKRTVPLPPPERCTAPGPPARLTPVGRLKWRVPTGGNVPLRVQAHDADGCPVTADLQWSASAGEVGADGRWRAGALAAGTSATVTAQAGEATVRFEVEVVPRPTGAPRSPTLDTDDLLPDEPGVPTAPAPQLPAHVGVGLDTHADTVEAPSRSFGTLLVGLFVGFGLLAALLSLWIAFNAWRLRRRETEAAWQRLAEVVPRPPSAAAAGARPAADAQRTRGQGGAPGLQVSAAGSQGAARRSVPPTPTTPVGGPAAPDLPADGPGSGDQITLAHPPLPPRGPRGCPTCGRCFDDSSRFCPYDASPLELLDAATEGAPTARVCPRCSSIFPATATHCGHDGSALVAAGTGTLNVPQLREKTCPTCGTHYPLDATFCGLDGASLVLLN